MYPVPADQSATVDALLERTRINASWIIKLRWAAAAGQLATITLVRYGLGVELPLAALLAILAFEVVSNLALARWVRGHAAGPRGEPALPRPDAPVLGHALGAFMLLDIVLLTALLLLTGGPTNPFSIFFMVNVVLAAVVLTPAWTWSVSILALGCYLGLFFYHIPLPPLDAMGYAATPDGDAVWSFGGRLSLYLRGLLVAFVAAAVVIVVFVTRLAAALSGLERELVRRRQRMERSARLEALGTLAAGAAHELASPLSTIAVVAKDLEKAIARGAVGAETEEDARLIRSEVARCRAILDQMALDGDQSTGEDTRPTTCGALVADALDGLRGADRVDVELADDSHALRLPRKAVALALRQVLKNALDASPADYHVTAQVRIEGARLLFRVRDQGQGMDEATRARATDPFFTTKEPGQGMGLGLFLTQTVVERLEGELEFDTVVGRGTCVTLRIPIAPAGGAGAGAGQPNATTAPSGARTAR